MIRCFVTDCSPLEDTAVYDRAYALLSDTRKGKADFYRFPKDRMLSITAGLFLRLIEGSYGAVTEDGNGKLRCQGIEFNLSHSGHYVTFAVSDDPVGIDIESIGHNRDIAKRVMDPQEYADFMDTVGEKDREEVFARMWTAKESYMKALGLGFRLPPESFRVLYGYDIRSPDGSMTISEPKSLEGFRISVCGKGDYSIRTVAVEELMDTSSLEDIL
ncbi:MAG: 4'-phosphopantetheinyl transferase superfamily protein [Candidatus Methanomethylophilaceae archaeon]|nr:4'-phosphopantetheinyl transferase superfamily protein [Candidatus Methanomethylophilaceae archaeon]